MPDRTRKTKERTVERVAVGRLGGYKKKITLEVTKSEGTNIVNTIECNE